MNRILAIIFAVLSVSVSFAQEELYDIQHIPEIKIYFTETNWDELLDQLYVAGDEERLMCLVEIDGTPLDSVGIRYKGFSSVSIDYVKNPFNIKLDYLIDGQNYQGFDKIKLSNVIQDPSFVREALSYEIARDYMPAGRANFAKVFINNEYWGLYTNVEAVNKDFLNDHFFTVENAFFKCNPEDLDFFGENSNLGDSPGSSESDYFELYDMKSNAGWSELIGLIDILNNDTENIDQVLNVDRALWMHAFNYALINFDSYVGYAQNYYLYEDINGRFNTILWDMNMSFASYRLSDASEYYDGFSIEQAKTIDPLQHIDGVTVFPRPLLRKLLEDDRYKRMYLAHLRTIVEEQFQSGLYLERATFIQETIDEAVETDANKFYSYQDFLDNLTMTTSDLIDYPGIAELIEARKDYLLEYPGIPDAPEINSVSVSNEMYSVGDQITVTATTENAYYAQVSYRFAESAVFESLEMTSSGDGIYTATLPPAGNVVQYYVYVDNDEAGRFSPERAAYEFYELNATVPENSLVINELMSNNMTTIVDGDNDFDDWVELYNKADYPLSTAGLYLSDDPLNPTKWEMPDVLIAPDSYLIIWADENGSEGSLHANFQFDSAGEFLSLARQDSLILDQVEFPEIGEDLSYARYPNGTGDFIIMEPTFNAFNSPTSVENLSGIEVSIFPNPTDGQLNIQTPGAGQFELRVFSTEGKLVWLESNLQNTTTLDISALDTGLYLCSIKSSEGELTTKIILQ